MARPDLAFLTAIALAAVAAGACAPQPESSQLIAQGAGSILVSSVPSAGSTVRSPVNQLVLTFDPPARLKQVVVTGPDGTMPTMITAVGEVPRYSVPLAGLGPGAYSVRWEASIGAETHEGSFGFTVK